MTLDRETACKLMPDIDVKDEHYPRFSSPAWPPSRHYGVAHTAVPICSIEHSDAPGGEYVYASPSRVECDSDALIATGIGDLVGACCRNGILVMTSNDSGAVNTECIHFARDGVVYADAFKDTRTLLPNEDPKSVAFVAECKNRLLLAFTESLRDYLFWCDSVPGRYAEAKDELEAKFEAKLQDMLQLFSKQYLGFDAFAHEMAGRLDEKKRQEEARSGDFTATDPDINANQDDAFMDADNSDLSHPCDSDGLGTLTENTSVSDIVAAVPGSPPSNTAGVTAAAAPARGTRRALNQNHIGLGPTLLTADLGKVTQHLGGILTCAPNSLTTTPSPSTSSSSSFPCLEDIRKLLEPIMGFTRYIQLTSDAPPAKPCAWFVMREGVSRGMPCRQIALANGDVCLQHLAIFNEYLQKEGFDRTRIIESVIALDAGKTTLAKVCSSLSASSMR